MWLSLFSSCGKRNRLSSYYWRPGGIGPAGKLLGIKDHVSGKEVLTGSDGRDNVTIWADRTSGALVGGRDYGAYGELLHDWWHDSSWREAFGNVGFGFGTEYTDESGLIYFGMRYYSPALGRFLSRDPIGEVGSGANLYAFAGNDPVNSRDLFGLCDGGSFFSAMVGSIGRALGGISGSLGNAFSAIWNWYVSPGGQSRPVEPSNSGGTLNGGSDSGGSRSGSSIGSGGRAAANQAAREAGNQARSAYISRYGISGYLFNYSEANALAGQAAAAAFSREVQRQVNRAAMELAVLVDRVSGFLERRAGEPAVQEAQGGNSLPGAPAHQRGGSSLGNALSRIPILGYALGPVGDVVSGVGNMLAGNFETGLSQIGYGMGDFAAATITDALDFAIGMTVGKMYAIGASIQNRSWRQFAASVIIPHHGFMTGANWGFDTKGHDNRSSVFRWTRLDYAALYHDYRSDLAQGLGLRPGIAHHQWIRDAWAGPGHEPGVFGQAIRLLGTPSFYIFGKVD